MKSAILPTSKLPSLSSLPNAFAPLSVAICNTVLAFITFGSNVVPFGRLAAKRIVSHISRSFPLIAPSVPSVRVTPASNILSIGAIPEPNFKFDIGLCTTMLSLSAINWISASSKCTQ